MTRASHLWASEAWAPGREIAAIPRNTSPGDYAIIREVFIAIEMPESEAWVIAQFLKRTVLDDFRAKCPPNEPDETELMRAAGERLRRAFASQGVDPR